MGKVCAVVSVKGGTGKTTTAVNTSIALANEGFKVLLMDANLEGSNVAFHLGISTRSIATIHDVVRKECKPRDAIYTHPSGLHLMLGGAYLEDAELRDVDLSKLIRDVKPLFDYVVVDCSSGLSLSVKSVIKSSDEVIIVTNPELPAVVDAFKVVQFCEKNSVFIRGVVINKASKHSDLSREDVSAILGRDIISVVPQDEHVVRSMRERTPIVNYKPRRRSARGFRNVAYSISGFHKLNPSFWERIISKFHP